MAPHTPPLRGPAVPRAGGQGGWVEGIDGNEITWAGEGGGRKGWGLALGWLGSGLEGEKGSVTEKRKVVVGWRGGVRTYLVGWCHAAYLLMDVSLLPFTLRCRLGEVEDPVCVCK